MPAKSPMGKIVVALVLLLILLAPARAQILGDVPEPEPLPLVTAFFPWTSPGAIIFDFWSISYFYFHSTIVQMTNLQLKAAQGQAVVNSLLTLTRRYIDAGERRFNALIAPARSGRQGKLQLDVETWERRYPNFAFGREALSDPRDLRLYDKYAYLKNDFIPKWEARVRPCLDYLKSEFALIRTGANKPLTDPDVKVLGRIIHDKLVGSTDPSRPILVGGQEISSSDEEKLVQALSVATPQAALAMCKARGPLSTLSLLTFALERKAAELSDNGGTPRSEMRVTVFNRAERLAVEVYVKPKDAALDPNIAGILIYPAKIRPEDQVEPRGLRPGGSTGSAWVTASPEDEIWVRAMTLGLRRDQVRFQNINARNVRLVPEALPRNFYRLEYGTQFPNPLFTKWSVTGEQYGWSEFEGPWNTTEQPRTITSPKSLRDRLFGLENVAADTLVWTLPDRDAVERLGELRATVNGTTKWHRQGPRSTIHHEEDEQGGGVVALRVEFW